jgi:putative cardiolipin synthase
MSRAIADAFADSIPARAYAVHLGPRGALEWVEHRPADHVVHKTEPGTSFWRRLGVSIMKLLPIEWLL